MGKSSGTKKQAFRDNEGSFQDTCNPYDVLPLLKRLLHTQKNLIYVLAGSASFITFLVYLPSLRNQFVEWDDGSYIYRNPFITSLNLTFLRWAFSDFSSGSWHPLTWISHALDYAVWGLNPLGHHLTNNMLHSVNTFILVLLAARLLAFRSGATGKNGPSIFLHEWAQYTAAGVTGLLFGLHPVHVESVAWVSERKDLLCALFFLLSILIYSNAGSKTIGENDPAGQPSRFAGKQYLLSLGFFILALSAKPMAISLPLILLILDWYPYRRIHSLKTLWNACVGKLPFLLVGAGVSILTMQTQSLSSSIGIIRLPMQLTVAAQSFVAYLWKMLLPVHLSPFYPYPHPDDVSLFSVTYSLPIFLAIAITFACVGIAKRQKLWLAVWGYYVITLLPVIGIIQVGSQSMADRYMYLPSIGPFLLCGLAVVSVLHRAARVPAGQWRRMITLVAIGLMIVVFLSLAYVTIKQIGIWKDSITLWSHVIQRDPERVPLAYNQRGKAFAEMGMTDRAVKDFNTAIALDPFFDKPYLNLGILFRKAGLYDKSIELFSWYLRVDPRNEPFLCNRGLSYYYHGQYEKALADFDKAIAINKKNTFAYFDRGNIHLKMENREQAKLDFEKACELGDRRGCLALQNLP